MIWLICDLITKVGRCYNQSLTVACVFCSCFNSRDLYICTDVIDNTSAIDCLLCVKCDI